MKIFLIIQIVACVLVSGSAQVIKHGYIQNSHWMDGIGTLDVIVFDKDYIYRQYNWAPNSQKLLLNNSGSYHVTNDTIYCRPATKNEASFELIVSKENKQNVLLKNEKVYNLDGSLSDLRIHGRPLKELENKQYNLFIKAREKN